MLPKPHLILLGSIGLTGTSCLTPMPPSAIEEITTCHHVELDTIRKNLLLAGFTIENQGAEDLTTGFLDLKQHAEGKTAMRITVVKRDAEIHRFVVRLKNVSYEYPARLTVGSAKAHSPHFTSQQSMSIGLGTPCPKSFEYERPYYEEHIGHYLDTQQTVCGPSSGKK